jgi:hypothetical protein
MDDAPEQALRRPVSVDRSHLRALIPMPFRRIGIRLTGRSDTTACFTSSRNPTVTDLRGSRPLHEGPRPYLTAKRMKWMSEDQSGCSRTFAPEYGACRIMPLPA